MEPITMTVPELAGRWQLSTRHVLELALQRSLPLYFYFDGLVFDFKDKWHRAHGDVPAARLLDEMTERRAVVELDLQRQEQHRKGLLKLTRWEDAFSDEAIHSHRVEADRLAAEIAQLSAKLARRAEERQRHVRNGVLRAAPKTVHELADQVGQAGARFPQYAYMPASAGEGQGASLEGGIVALEDGFPLRTRLNAADVFANFQDIKAIEGLSQV